MVTAVSAGIRRYGVRMTREEARDATLSTGDVARALGLSTDTVARIPKDRLDYWRTPGGHRRYRCSDVAAYAREYLGRS